MNDFASAAMVRLLVQGMRNIGLVPRPEWQAEGAQVALATKREVVQAVVQARGAAALLDLPQALHDTGFDPTLAMLCAQPDPAGLLQRWQRLERYVHSRHRVVVHEAGERRLCLSHVSIVAGHAPLPAEDLIVLGMLVALLQRTGARGVEASLDDGEVYPRTAAGDACVAHACREGRTARWHLRWVQWCAPDPGASAAASPLDLETLARRGTHGWPPLSSRVVQAVVQDGAHAWSLRELAQRLGLSARTLQRGLAQEGTRYATLVSEARVRLAAAWLTYTALPLAQVGVIAGFADQAHFTRRFRQRIGLPPGAYRERF